MKRLIIAALASGLSSWGQTPIVTPDSTGARVFVGNATNSAVQVVCINPTTHIAESCAGSGGGGGGSVTQGTVPWVTDGSATTQPISAAALPLPAGASTAAKQPSLGTAGAASADVITVQGIASMTALKVDGSGVTQPVSGTFWQATQPISASSLPLPTGASTLAEQQTQTTALQLLDDTVATTASAITSKGFAASGTDGTNARILKTDTSGELQIDVLTMPTTAVSQSGTWTVQPGNTANTTAWLVTGTGGTFPATQSGNWTARIVGNGGAVLDAVNTAATAPASGLLGLGIYNSTEPSPTTGQSVGIQLDAKGRQRQVIMDAAGNTRGANVDANNNLQVVNAAETTKVLGTVRVLGNVGAIFDGATGAAPPANGLFQVGIGSGATGGLLIGQTVCDSWVAINTASSGATQLISGVSGRKIYFCSGNLQMNGGANTVTFYSGTGTACATGSTAVPGFDGATSAANGYSFAANSGITWAGANGAGFARTTNNADNFCINLGSATRVVGGLSYAIY